MMPPLPSPLRDWMDARGITVPQMHDRLEKAGLHCTEYAVKSWVKGRRRPLLAFRERIAAITDGAVPVDGWEKSTK